MPGQPPDNIEKFLGVPERTAELIVRYLDGNLLEQDLAELRAALKQSAAARDLFVRWGVQTQALAEALVPQYSESDSPASLEQLLEMEANAPAQLVHLTELRERKQKKQKNPNEPTPQDYINAGRYVLRMTLTSKPAKKFYTWSSIAAVLLLAFVLFNPFASDTPDTVADLDFWDDTDTSTPPAVAPGITPVATITATHDAQWDSQPAEDFRRGTKLHPNQRLTLTAGFAEITTARGAVATLQAPATIELLNNDNALRLHAGKLVGICETDASKGFVVRTPHMDITDLGTRFGVDTLSRETEVHVFEGEVQAERVDTAADTLPTLLVANQSARISADTDVITRIDHRTDRFAALLPTTTQLPGTGHGLAVGDTDPNWQIVAIDGQPLDQPQLASVSGLPIYTDSIPNDPQRSQWLSWYPGHDDAAIYTFRTTVELPEGAGPTARIDVRYVADNQLRAIIVNGHRIERESGPIGTEWIYREARLQEHLRPGENTIEFEVANIVVGGRPAGELALKVQWQLTTTPGLRNTEQSRPQSEF